MVPSHRRVGFADADPALNPLPTKAWRITGPALSFRGIGFFEEFLHATIWELEETKLWPGGPRPTLRC